MATRDRGAQDHRADILSRGGLEDVRATAGAVADVVAYEVGDDGGIARVILWDAGLDLAHEVRADVGGLGVDAAAKLGKEGDEAGAEPEADDSRRRVEGVVQAAEADIDQRHAEQAEGDDQEAGDRAAAQRDHQRVAEALAGRAGDPNIRADGDLHADEPRDARAERADGEGEGGLESDEYGAGEIDRSAAYRWTGDIGQRGQQRADDDRGDDRQRRNGRYCRRR